MTARRIKMFVTSVQVWYSQFIIAVNIIIRQEVLERTNLLTFLTLSKNIVSIKTSVCPNITLVGNSVPILKHSHIQNNVSNKRIVGSS
jgi:hypothetical protein